MLVGQFQIRIAQRFGIHDAISHGKLVFPARRFLFQCLHVAGIGINRQQRVPHVHEVDGIRPLAEDRQVRIHLAVQHRNHGQRVRMFQDVTDAVPIKGDVFPGEFLRILRCLEVLQEGGEIGIYPAQERAFLRSLNRIVSQGIALYVHPVAALQQQARQRGLAPEQVHEIRISRFHIDPVGEAAVLARLKRVKNFKLVEIQEFDNDLAFGETVHGTAHHRLVRAGCQHQRSGQHGRKSITDSHIL